MIGTGRLSFPDFRRYDWHCFWILNGYDRNRLRASQISFKVVLPGHEDTNNFKAFFCRSPGFQRIQLGMLEFEND
ncbi:unnamed protein product [Rhizophagus irregularis]|nr:unnamed protein product [Rhizophagus irregularis]